MPTIALPTLPSPSAVSHPLVVPSARTVERWGVTVVSWMSNAVQMTKPVIRPRCFEFFGLSHSLGQPGWYWDARQGVVQSVATGDLVISAPGVAQDYGSAGAGYREDAVAFDGPLARSMLEDGYIHPGVVHIGSERRLAGVIEQLQRPGKAGHLRAQAYLLGLLADVHEAGSVASPNRHGALERLLEEIASDPLAGWTPEVMADRCSLSPRQFRRIFVARVGMGPKVYIDRLVMQRAASELRSSSRPVAEIAARHGYTDPYHFSRRFRNLIGEPPDQHRREDPLRSSR